MQRRMKRDMPSADCRTSAAALLLLSRELNQDTLLMLHENGKAKCGRDTSLLQNSWLSLLCWSVTSHDISNNCRNRAFKGDGVHYQQRIARDGNTPVQLCKISLVTTLEENGLKIPPYFKDVHNRQIHLIEKQPGRLSSLWL